MSLQLRGSAALRARRIHDLERIADDRREHLRIEAVSVARGLAEMPVVQAVTRGVERGRALASSFSTGNPRWSDLAKGVFATAGFQSSSQNGARKFPWKSALSAAVGLIGVYRWWKHRHD